MAGEEIESLVQGHRAREGMAGGSQKDTGGKRRARGSERGLRAQGITPATSAAVIGYNDYLE